MLISHEHPSNPPGEKFSAPVFDPKKYLYRDLADFGFPSPGDIFPCFVFLEGQAGQSKTTQVAQLLHQRKELFFWYRMGEADRSAAYFLGSLRSLPAIPEADGTTDMARTHKQISFDEQKSLMKQPHSGEKANFFKTP